MDTLLLNREFWGGFSFMSDQKKIESKSGEKWVSRNFFGKVGGFLRLNGAEYETHGGSGPLQ